MTCSVCGEKKIALNLCNKHYLRFRKYGDTSGSVKPRGALEQRFWTKVHKSESCWNWTGASKTSGYGMIQKGGRGSPQLLAHRVSYTIHKGPIPDGLNVLHSCDNPSCVNPDHLRVGTYSENNRDTYDRKRRISPFSLKENRSGKPCPVMPGASHPNAKLDDHKVKEIRSSNDRLVDIAERYNISVSVACAIRQRKAWKHVE